MKSLEELPDEELVRRAQEGDGDALTVLSRRTAARLHPRIQARLSQGMRRRVAASDILQEAHIVALRHLADFEDRGSGSFERWFRKIVELKVHESVRHHVDAEKRSVRREVSASRYGPTPGSSRRDPSPSQVLAGEELRDAVRRAFSLMQPHFREVLILLQERRLTIEEAAEQMGRSVAATRKLYGRALSQLEALMGIEPDGKRRPTR